MNSAEHSTELSDAQKAAFKPVEKVEAGVAKTNLGVSDKAVDAIRAALAKRGTPDAALRVGIKGGGCSGFSYSMAFETNPGMLDKTYNFEGLKVFVDQASLLYLDGAEVDYVESLEGSGFKFNNPNVKSTCGCGSSFNA